MKSTAKNDGLARQRVSSSPRHVSSARSARSLAPPRYGVDAVDQGALSAGHSSRCGCSSCAGPSWAPTASVASPGQTTATAAPVIQLQCATCGNALCNDGSLCGKRKRKFQPGQHGFKTAEQKRLKDEFQISVSGSTHESEHTVGFEPINQTSGLKRGTQGRARDLEYQAPAYQEVKELHRAHIGTGTRGTADESGFTSTSYRESQRRLLEDEDLSSAVQLNQLAYAFDPAFSTKKGTTEWKAASDSYNVMVGGMSSFTYAHGASDVSFNVTPFQRAEMYAARYMQEKGISHLSDDEKWKILARFGA